MPHRVPIGRSRLFDLLVIYTEGFGRSLDLIRCTGETDDIGIKGRDKPCQLFGRITLRINRNKKRLDLGRVRAEPIHDGGNLGQGRGADIRAIRKAEEHEHPAPCEVFVRLHLALVIGKFEIRPERRIISPRFASGRNLQPNEPNNRDCDESPKHFL